MFKSCYKANQCLRYPYKSKQMSELNTTRTDRYKIIFDYLKHLATLSTGSIVLVTTFLDKMFIQPQWKFLVVSAISGFMTSVVGSIVHYTLMIFDFPGNRKPGALEKRLMAYSLIFSWAGFLIGIISLSLFAIKNLL